ncbi:MAG: DUF4340 domain-containing protein [Rhodothermales bacterium]|nr:DUF4340 domain-containing protein [Rhodothermales bacterium]
MQQRQLLWLLGALVVLVGLAVLFGTFNKGASTLDLPTIVIPGDELTRIVITRDGEPFTFEKQAGVWQIVEPVTGKADSALVAQLTVNLSAIEVETVVSNSPDRYAEYGLGEREQQVDLIWNGGGATLLVGGIGPDPQTHYVRMATDPRVYLVRGRLSLPDDTDRWRDKTVLSIPPLTVQKAVVTGPDAGYELTLDASGWTLSIDGDEEPADSARVTAWLARFSPLVAIGFTRGAAAADIKTTATHQVHFSIPNAGTQTLWIENRETELAVTATGQDAALRLNYDQLGLLAPEASAFE